MATKITHEQLMTAINEEMLTSGRFSADAVARNLNKKRGNMDIYIEDVQRRINSLRKKDYQFEPDGRGWYRYTPAQETVEPEKPTETTTKKAPIFKNPEIVLSEGLDGLFAQVFGAPVASDPIADYVAWMSKMLAKLLIADRLPVLSIATKRYGKMDLKLVDVLAADGAIMFRFASPVATPSYGQFNGVYFAEDTILHTTTTKDAESAIAQRVLKATKKAFEQYC